MKRMTRKATRHVNQNEGLIFEKSSAGKAAWRLPPLDVPEVDASELLGAAERKDLGNMPEVSEIEIIRHFTRLSTWNYAIDLGMYPLGSCTMKYNPRVNEFVARLEGLAGEHPQQPAEVSQGCLRILWDLQTCLLAITGMDAATLQPAAGAQGELAGLLMIRAYLASKGKPRKKVLIPDSAHGTNPASVVIAGYEVQNIKSNSRGKLEPDHLPEFVPDDDAAILHERGALLYMDGPNMNALAGVTRPGDFGVDVMHLNLHKTFSTPHGGGGPGSGPVAIKKILEPFLPKPVVITHSDGTLGFEYNRPHSVGRVRAFYGNFGMFVRALAYIQANGPDGLRQTTEDAVLNANYIRKGLEGTYDLPYSTPTMHEVVFSDKLQAKNGVRTMDIAKRLIDYGFHPSTTAFPLIVPGALMIEPTESESKQEMDLFIEAMKSIAEEVEEDPQTVLDAPHSTRVSRLDETAAARKPVLRWKPAV